MTEIFTSEEKKHAYRRAEVDALPEIKTERGPVVFPADQMTDLVNRLIDACNILDTEATQSRTLTEGQLGTSVIRHIINGGTLDTYPDH